MSRSPERVSTARGTSTRRPEGGPPAQYDCAVSEASTRVDGFVGIAGAYDLFVGYEGTYGRDFLLEHEPDLWEMLWGTVGLHPELRVRLIHGDSDGVIPLENSAGFEAVLAEAGYDVELVEFEGGHFPPGDLAVETVMELVAVASSRRLGCLRHGGDDQTTYAWRLLGLLRSPQRHTIRRSCCFPSRPE